MLNIQKSSVSLQNKNSLVLKQCPLCEGTSCLTFEPTSQPIYKYNWCGICDLIFLDSEYHLTQQEEAKRYLLHQYEDTLKYRNFYQDFLEQFVPTLHELRKSLVDKYEDNEDRELKNFSTRDRSWLGPGIDYGSGPKSLLKTMLFEIGFELNCYDPFFALNEEVFSRNYYWAVSTEVFEHFRVPKSEIRKFFELIYDGGIIGVMTSFHSGLENFDKWYYRRDPTHVSFYSEKTFEWICSWIGVRKLYSNKNVFICQKI